MDITEDTKDCNVNGVSVETDEHDDAKTKGKIGTRLNKRTSRRFTIPNFAHATKYKFVSSD